MAIFYMHKIDSRTLLSWAKYNHRKIKEGTFDEEKQDMYNTLLVTSSNEHTRGRWRMKKPVINLVLQDLV